jgi:transcriptional regulator with XRE-family HTH domain
MVHAMTGFGNELCRLLEERGMSLREAARRAPCDSGYLSKVAHGTRRPSDELAGRLDRMLGAEGTLAALAATRRDVLKLGLAAPLTPEALRLVLAESAGDAMEFTAEASATAVGKSTFAQLDAVADGLDRAYSAQAPAGLFPLARHYRARVQRLAAGPCTLAEKRELYVYAARLSEILAWLAHDLGNPLAAHAWAVDCFEHADQAGHGELCGWATDAMASVALYAGRPRRVIEAAMAGLARVPAGHVLAVRLQAQAARGHARLGERDACMALIAAAEGNSARPPAQQGEQAPGDALLAAFAVTSYPASCHVWLGDFAAAVAYARRAVEVHESSQGSGSSPSREAIARIDLAIALAGQGEPGEAAALGCQALGSPRMVDSVRARACDLDTILAARYPGQVDAAVFRARYAQMAAAHRGITA